MVLVYYNEKKMLHIFDKALENIFLLGFTYGWGTVGKGDNRNTGSVVRKAEKVQKGARAGSEERHYVVGGQGCSKMVRFQLSRSHRLWKQPGVALQQHEPTVTLGA